MTVDDLGKETFATGGALDRIQKVQDFSLAHLIALAPIMVHDIILLKNRWNADLLQCLNCLIGTCVIFLLPFLGLS